MHPSRHLDRRPTPLAVGTPRTKRRRTHRAATLIAGVVALGVTVPVIAGPAGASYQQPHPTPTAAASAPGSIVYLRSHNIWITDAAGATQRAATTNGTAKDPWASPTQSDAGVIVAHRAGIVVEMNQRGQVIRSFDPPDLYDTLGHPMSGRDLVETAISPNGKRIAYTYFKLWGGTKRWTTGFTSSDAITDPDTWGLSFYDNPAWVTNNRVVLNSWYRNKTHLYDLGERDIAWFDERYYTPNAKELSDLEVSRDGDWTVGVRGDVGDQSIVVIHNEGDVQTSATPWTPVYGVTNPCNIGYADGNLVEPTIAPDSSTIAWAEPAGIYRASDLNCDSATRVDILVAAGGSDPHWSPAAIGQTPDVPQPLRMLQRPRITGTAKAGSTLTASPGRWTPKPASVAYRWLRDGKPLARATAPRLKLRGSDRGHRFAVTVTVRRAGSKPTSVTSNTVTVRR